jgi:hypothetical protein
MTMASFNERGTIPTPDARPSCVVCSTRMGLVLIQPDRTGIQNGSAEVFSSRLGMGVPFPHSRRTAPKAEGHSVHKSGWSARHGVEGARHPAAAAGRDRCRSEAGGRRNPPAGAGDDGMIAIWSKTAGRLARTKALGHATKLGSLYRCGGRAAPGRRSKRID